MLYNLPGLRTCLRRAFRGRRNLRRAAELKPLGMRLGLESKTSHSPLAPPLGAAHAASKAHIPSANAHTTTLSARQRVTVPTGQRTSLLQGTAEARKHAPRTYRPLTANKSNTGLEQWRTDTSALDPAQCSWDLHGCALLKGGLPSIITVAHASKADDMEAFHWLGPPDHLAQPSLARDGHDRLKCLKANLPSLITAAHGR